MAAATARYMSLICCFVHLAIQFRAFSSVIFPFMAELSRRTCFICGLPRPVLLALPHEDSLVEACTVCFLTIEVRNLAARLPNSHPALELSAEGLESLYQVLRTAVVDREAQSSS